MWLIRIKMFSYIYFFLTAIRHYNIKLHRFVCSFSAQEKKIVDEALDRALDAAECIISRGVTEAQNRFN